MVNQNRDDQARWEAAYQMWVALEAHSDPESLEVRAELEAEMEALQAALETNERKYYAVSPGGKGGCRKCVYRADEYARWNGLCAHSPTGGCTATVVDGRAICVEAQNREEALAKLAEAQ